MVFGIAVAAILLAAPTSLGAPATTASECTARASLPDPQCTPGALNPHVTQRNIRRTICVPNWTDTVRPSTSYTNALKVKDIRAYGFRDKRLGDYEEDHLIP